MIEYIFLLGGLLWATITSAFPPQIYKPEFHTSQSQIHQSYQTVNFTTGATGSGDEEFICWGKTSVNGVDFIQTRLPFKSGISPKYINFNISYSGPGYPRLLIGDPAGLPGLPFVCSASSEGRYLIPLEMDWPGKSYYVTPGGIYGLQFIFFVVSEEHKDTAITGYNQLFGSMPIIAPINGTFSFTIEATFDDTTYIFGQWAIDPWPEAGPLSPNQSYIQTRTMTNESETSFLDRYDYFDGLGRHVQTVEAGTTPSGNDLVTIQQYDGFGRKHRSWLPTPIGSNNGNYVNPNTVMSGAKETYDDDRKPYSFPVYEESPLERVIEQYGPGAIWSNKKKAVRTELLTNSKTSDTLNCIHYIVHENLPADSLSLSPYRMITVRVRYILPVLKTKMEVQLLSSRINGDRSF